MDAWFTPYSAADESNFIDVVDGDHNVFTLYIIKSIEDNVGAVVSTNDE